MDGLLANPSLQQMILDGVYTSERPCLPLCPPSPGSAAPAPDRVLGHAVLAAGGQQLVLLPQSKPRHCSTLQQ